MAAEAKSSAQRLADDLNQLKISAWLFDWRSIKEKLPVQAAMNAQPSAQIELMKHIAAQIGVLESEIAAVENTEERLERYLNINRETNFPRAGSTVLSQLLRRKSLQIPSDDLAQITSSIAQVSFLYIGFLPAIADIVSRAERANDGGELTPALIGSLNRLRDSLLPNDTADARKLCVRLSSATGTASQSAIVPGEKWSDQAILDIAEMLPAVRVDAIQLIDHCSRISGNRPSLKWLKSAKQMVHALGATRLAELLQHWFPLVDLPRTQVLPEREWVPDPNRMLIDLHMDILKGLCWCSPFIADNDDAATSRLLGNLAISCFRKVPKIGPRAVRVGNAAVGALSEIGTEAAVGQLALLKVKVKFGTAQKEIEKAFNVAAAKLGLPREEIEELGVPTYGLEEVGKRRESFCDGEFVAEIVVDGRDAKLNWFKADGKPLKSPPAKVKAEHKDDLKELQLAAKDIAAMLPAQSERIDGLFLAQKSWPIAVWRERYLDHPLIGTIARRLIWLVRDSKDATPVATMWKGGALVDLIGKPISLSNAAIVELWHPIARPPEEVLAWRDFIQKHEIRQPFKQAYREVYPLTEAERRTNTYSNRFASHIIRQHQFNALCGARGWKNQLRLMVDQEFPPARKSMPQWNLRAEFWIEGIGENYGQDTNETGTYHRLSTDQVRFYRIGAAENLAHAGGGRYTTAAYGAGTHNINEPLPLDQIPPLVFSEVMRDVDLFVGVASVGNDPNWQDGGPEGRFRDYWQSYSFGELGETAKTRRVVLERLLPRLTKLKDRWSLSEKFLVIKGSIRTYKIHLGSGNILMEPNDQYLCIVPDRSTRATAVDGVFLPFEGDATLSIILSKAFLLVDDAKISDPTITRQLH